MLGPGTVVRSPRGTVVEIVENTPDRFRLRRELPPATGKALPHRQMNAVQTFRVLDGEATGMAAGGRPEGAGRGPRARRRQRRGYRAVT